MAKRNDSMYYMIGQTIFGYLRDARKAAYELHYEKYMRAWKEPIYVFNDKGRSLLGYVRYDSRTRSLYWDCKEGTWKLTRYGYTGQRCRT